MKQLNQDHTEETIVILSKDQTKFENRFMYRIRYVPCRGESIRSNRTSTFSIIKALIIEVADGQGCGLDLKEIIYTIWAFY